MMVDDAGHAGLEDARPPRPAEAVEHEDRGGLTYAAAGVNIDAGERAVELIKDDLKATAIPGVLGGVGGFAAMYELPEGMDHPVLVTATDGVGTKLLVAQEVKKVDTVGVDLVAMSVNDVLTMGARPVLFLDYVATGRLDPDEMAQVVRGVALGCRIAGCALVGGEMAEMPGLYDPEEFDLAGFCVGLAERDAVIDGSGTVAGDVVIGLASSGFHSNGFSLIRRVLEANQVRLGDRLPHLGETVADTLLVPTRIYVQAVLQLLDTGVPIHAMAHITGGGLGGNLSRVIPEGLTAGLDFAHWKVPRIFRAIQHLGDIADREMFRTFNMGVGFVIVVPASVADRAYRALRRGGEEPMYLGEVEESAGDRRVALEGVF